MPRCAKGWLGPPDVGGRSDPTADGGEHHGVAAPVGRAYCPLVSREVLETWVPMLRGILAPAWGSLLR